MPKIIGFFGIHPEDICLYMAFALQNMGKDVCVIDNSKQGIVYTAIPTPDKKLETVTCRNVDFMRHVPEPEKWHQLPYDYLLLHLGADMQMKPAEYEKLILVTDCEKSDLAFYRQRMQELKTLMFVVLRDICPDSVSGKKLKEYFEQENCFIEKWFSLYLTEEDYSYRIRMQYEPVGKFSHLSQEMELMIVQLLRAVLNKEATGAGKAVRAVKKGKVL